MSGTSDCGEYMSTLQSKRHRLGHFSHLNEGFERYRRGQIKLVCSDLSEQWPFLRRNWQVKKKKQKHTDVGFIVMTAGDLKLQTVY